MTHEGFNSWLYTNIIQYQARYDFPLTLYCTMIQSFSVSNMIDISGRHPWACGYKLSQSKSWNYTLLELYPFLKRLKMRLVEILDAKFRKPHHCGLRLLQLVTRHLLESQKYEHEHAIVISSVIKLILLFT